ncbi:MAG: class I SAM-dependent methyltransferase [Candidatus Dormibacteria bacterium]
MSSADTGNFAAASVAEIYRELLEPAIFQPWAERLLDAVDVAPGMVVADVAAGTGVVARLAARRVGPGGRVIATDISPGMLAQVTAAAEAGAGAVEVVECSATELRIPDASVDAVFCQQGLQFIRERERVVAEMRRILRVDGVAGIAVWQPGGRLEPFDTYADALEAAGVPEPFPHAYEKHHFTIPAEQLTALLEGAGFVDVTARPHRLDLRWPSVEIAARGMMGTPYGPSVAELAESARETLFQWLRERMSGPGSGPAPLIMAAVIGTGVAAG